MNNTQINHIQKNMQTSFKGYVNGQKFTNRDEMNQFIGKCISEGTPINNISYSTQTQYKPAEQTVVPGRVAIRQAQENISWITYINNLNQRVPRPYDTVTGYVVPFVREDIDINAYNKERIIDDFKARLNDRMIFLENYVFSQICTWKYDESQVNQWLEHLSNSFKHKLDWANMRVAIIEEFLNHTNEFIINRIDSTALRCFHDIYNETAGFCSTIIDVIAELKTRLQQDCE